MKASGGTAIFIKKKTIPHDNIQKTDLEHIECTCNTILLNNQETTIAAVYNQHSKALLISDLD